MPEYGPTADNPDAPRSEPVDPAKVAEAKAQVAALRDKLTDAPPAVSLAERDAQRTARAREIRARLDAADTPGPWEIEPDEHGSRLGSATRWVGQCPDCGTTAQFDHADAELIAHAPQDLAYLLEENWRLDQLARVTEAMGLAKIAELNARVAVLEGQLAAVREALDYSTDENGRLTMSIQECGSDIHRGVFDAAEEEEASDEV